MAVCLPWPWPTLKPYPGSERTRRGRRKTTATPSQSYEGFSHGPPGRGGAGGVGAAAAGLGLRGGHAVAGTVVSGEQAIFFSFGRGAKVGSVLKRLGKEGQWGGERAGSEEQA